MRASICRQLLCHRLTVPWRSIVVRRELVRPLAGPPVTTNPCRTLFTAPAIPLPPSESTIFALSTPPGRGGIAVVRLSGPHTRQVYHALCPNAAPLAPRHAALRKLYHPSSPPSRSTILDHALCLFFPGPHSVTGQDVLELHLHGGPAIAAAVLAALPLCHAQLGAVRHAEAGEFTRRAFENGRMDLVAVEALGDTLSALTESQRRLAIRGSSSGLGDQYERWRRDLLYARGEMEALIDFSEDQHFDESSVELVRSVAAQVDKLKSVLETHIKTAERGELLRDGIKVTFLGAPNAGKSSLLNRIVRREAAIVSAEPGTTRDVVEAAVDIRGYLVRFGDTAGLRVDAPSAIEQEGMRRAKDLARDADLIIAVLPFSQDGTLALDAEVMHVLAQLQQEGRRVHVALNKVDLAAHAARPVAAATLRRALAPDTGVSFVSCVADDAGINDLLEDMAGLFGRMTAAAPEAEDALSATARQRALMEECVAHLDAFLDVAEGQPGVQGEDVDLVLAAEHLRAAAGCLARITGRAIEQGDVEEVLGVVFEKFCVGK